MRAAPQGLEAWSATPGGRAVVEAVRARAARGASLDRGALRVDLDDRAREDVGRLLGIRWETSGRSVTLTALGRALRTTYALGVRDAVELLDGEPLVSRAQRRAESDEARAEERSRAATTLVEAGVRDDVALAWIDDPATPRGGDGSLERLARDVARVRRSIGDGTTGQRLAEVASAVVGDAHGLDRDTHLGRSVALLLGAERAERAPLSSEQWRRVWRSAGVFCDEVSSQVLVLNLPLVGAAPAVALAQAAPGEPTWLTLRSLADEWSVSARCEVFVCENPTVVEAAADRLGRACAPLVCTCGRPSQAALDLIRGLASAGCTIVARADFDVVGAGIVEQIRAVAPDVRPWRFSRQDYAAAGGRGRDRDAAPDPTQTALGRRDLTNAVHEERILELLLADLVRCHPVHSRRPEN